MASNNSELISHIEALREEVKESKSCSCSWVLSLDHLKSEISRITAEGNTQYNALKSEYMIRIRELQNELNHIQSVHERELAQLRKHYILSLPQQHA